MGHPHLPVVPPFWYVRDSWKARYSTAVDPTPGRVSDSVGMRYRQEICLSNKQPKDADVAGLRTTF